MKFEYLIAEVSMYKAAHLIAQLEGRDHWNWEEVNCPHADIDGAAKCYVERQQEALSEGECEWELLIVRATDVPVTAAGLPCYKDVKVHRREVTAALSWSFYVSEGNF